MKITKAPLAPANEPGGYIMDMANLLKMGATMFINSKQSGDAGRPVLERVD